MGTSPGSPGGSSRTPPPSQRSLPFPPGPREMQPPPPIRGTEERTGSRCILTRPPETHTHTHRSTCLPPRASYRPRHRGSSRVPGMQDTAWALERRLQPPRVAAWSSGRRCSWDWPGAGAGARIARVRPAGPGSAPPRPAPPTASAHSPVVSRRRGLPWGGAGGRELGARMRPGAAGGRSEERSGSSPDVEGGFGAPSGTHNLYRLSRALSLPPSQTICLRLGASPWAASQGLAAPRGIGPRRGFSSPRAGLSRG